jgi:phosphatidate cytidylyltransferase
VQLRRWLTAVAVLCIVVPVVLFGGPWLFMALMALIVILCQLEFDRLVGSSQSVGWRVAGPGVALLLPVGAMLGGERGMLLALVGTLLLWMIVLVLLRRQMEGTLEDLGPRILGYLYAALLPSYFVLLWKLANGVHWIFLLMTITAVGDTAAYYAGSLWGSHKLLPRVSPQKSIQGSLAGLLGNVAGALAYTALLFPAQLSYAIVPFALAIGVMGQLGDLSESLLKRSRGKKDSGDLLPGHGGVLDRLDSLLFSVPVMYYWVTI